MSYTIPAGSTKSDRVERRRCMSGAERLPYREALPIAQAVFGQLDPSCVRLEIAGSLRRRANDFGEMRHAPFGWPEQDRASVCPSCIWKLTRAAVDPGSLTGTDRLALAVLHMELTWAPVRSDTSTGALEAIPPAYTEWIGRQLIASLRGAA